jgi:hypothetical protein
MVCFVDEALCRYHKLYMFFFLFSVGLFLIIQMKSCQHTVKVCAVK